MLRMRKHVQGEQCALLRDCRSSIEPHDESLPTTHRLVVGCAPRAQDPSDNKHNFFLFFWSDLQVLLNVLRSKEKGTATSDDDDDDGATERAGTRGDWHHVHGNHAHAPQCRGRARTIRTKTPYFAEAEKRRSSRA